MRQTAWYSTTNCFLNYRSRLSEQITSDYDIVVGVRLRSFEYESVLPLRFYPFGSGPNDNYFSTVRRGVPHIAGGGARDPNQRAHPYGSESTYGAGGESEWTAGA